MQNNVIDFKPKKPPAEEPKRTEDISPEAKDEAIRALTQSTRYYNQRANKLARERKALAESLSDTTKALSNLTESAHLLQIMLHNQRVSSQEENKNFFQKIASAFKGLFPKVSK